MKEALITTIVQFLKTSAGLNNAQVKRQRHKGPKKTHPHLVVNLPLGDETIGSDTTEYSISDTDAPQMRMAGDRRFLVSVHGFGEESFDWIATAKTHLTLGYPGEKVLRAEGLTLKPINHIRDVSTPLETGIQAHYIQEFELLCRVRGEAIELKEAVNFEIELNEPNP